MTAQTSAEKAEGSKPPKPAKPSQPGKARRGFRRVAGAAVSDKVVQPAAIVTSILLGTTALATPVLGTMIGAGVALAGGLYLLSKTSDVVVNNARCLGTKAGIDPMTLGVALGVLTSLPELFVSGGAMLQKNPGIGIGNIVGSNIANLLLVLGATAAIRKVQTKGVSWKFNAVAMGATTALFGAQMALGVLSPVVGGLLLAGLGGYMMKSLHDSRKASKEAKKNGKSAAPVEEDGGFESKLPGWANIGIGLAGVGGLIGSAGFVVAAATAFGTALGVSPAVIGLLAVAVGTSLPEIMVNVKSALKGDTTMALGNILGSNVFNLAMIGGMLSLSGLAGAGVPMLDRIVQGVPMAADFNAQQGAAGIFNTVALGAATLLTIGVLAKSKEGIKRWHGLAGVGLYAAFTAATCFLGRPPAETAETPTPAAITAPAAPAPNS